MKETRHYFYNKKPSKNRLICHYLSDRKSLVCVYLAMLTINWIILQWQHKKKQIHFLLTNQWSYNYADWSRKKI